MRGEFARERGVNNPSDSLAESICLLLSAFQLFLTRLSLTLGVQSVRRRRGGRICNQAAVAPCPPCGTALPVRTRSHGLGRDAMARVARKETTWESDHTAGHFGSMRLQRKSAEGLHGSLSANVCPQGPDGSWTTALHRASTPGRHMNSLLFSLSPFRWWKARREISLRPRGAAGLGHVCSF